MRGIGYSEAPRSLASLDWSESAGARRTDAAASAAERRMQAASVPPRYVGFQNRARQRPRPRRQLALYVTDAKHLTNQG